MLSVAIASFHICCCLDIDECALNISGCEDECTDTVGSFICSCNRIGFELAANNLNCTGKEVSKQKLQH